MTITSSRGPAVSSTADSVTFEHVLGESSETTTYPADSIDPHSFYLVRQEAVADSPAEKVKLGEYCMAHGLFTRARNQFIEAQRMDSSLDLTRQIAACKNGTATGLLADARQMMTQGDSHGAYRKVRQILRNFPKTKAAADARKLAGSLSTRFDDQFAAQQTAEIDRDWNVKLNEVREMIGRAAQLDARGNSEESSATGRPIMENSAKIYADAAKKLDEYAKQAQGNKEVEAAIAELKGHASDGQVAVHLDVSSILAAQTDFAGAAGATNEALAVDPDNAQAKSMRANIATQAALEDVMVYPAVRRR